MFSGLDALDTAPEAPAPVQPDILDLTEAMEASNAQAASFRTVDAEADVDFNEQMQPPPVAETVAEARRQFQQSMPPLLSPSTTAAVDTAFNTLAQTVLVKNARTLEEMVAEMLRPMLKTWLDDNLPGMVERIVRDEIERVSRGRVGPK
jgi:cell pole-organizing protein PopZ